MARGLRRTDGFFDGGGVTPSPTPSLQLYKRTYGTVDYLVDVDGKLITDDTVYVEVGASGNPNACVLSLCSTNTDLSDVIAAWGKTTAVFSSQELGTTDYTITIGDDFVDIVGEVATPAIQDLVAAAFYLREWQNDYHLLVDKDGKLVLFNDEGEGTPSEDDFYTVFKQNNTWDSAEGSSEAPWYNTQLLEQWGYNYYVGSHDGATNRITATEAGKAPTEYVVDVNNNTAEPTPAAYA